MLRVTDCAHPHRLLAAAAHGALDAKGTHAVNNISRQPEGHLGMCRWLCVLDMSRLQ